MTGPFIVVTAYRGGQSRLVNAAHIQLVYASDLDLTIVRFSRQAMLDQHLIEVETYEDELEVRESFEQIAAMLGIVVVDQVEDDR